MIGTWEGYRAIHYSEWWVRILGSVEELRDMSYDQ